jgi:hypothetical protein
LFDQSPFAKQILDVFANLSVVVVTLPVEEELDFANAHFGGKPGVAKLIAEIRDLQRNVAHSVDDKAFEQAAKSADQRNALLDQLYKRCTA